MRTKTFWILVLAAAICVGGLLSSEASTSRAYEEKKSLLTKKFLEVIKNTERDTLVGLKGVAVLVDALNPEAEKYGLTKQKLQTDIELHLHRNVIRILSDNELSKAPGGPMLVINVIISKISEELGLTALYVRVEFKQYVLLKRDPSVVRFCDTWREEGVTLILLKDLKNIREFVKDAVDIFCNDYLRANPKEKEAKRKNDK